MDGGRGKPKAQAAAAHVSVAALDKRLHIRRRAREDAGQDQPRVDALQLSPTERAVMDAAALERAKLDLAIASARMEAERRLRALAPTAQDFNGPVLEARLTLKQIEGRLTQNWAAAAERRRQAREHLKRFKEENGLHRLAVYPDAPLLQAGMLLCAAVFEALFSAALFAEDDARGLLGGAVTAIGLSGANVSLGFLAGFLGLRYLQHSQPTLKSLGGVGFSLLAMLSTFLNLFAANWRDALAGAQDSSSASPAWIEFLRIETPQAIILLMLGGGVWVFSALKGYSGFDDPYPDYGKMDRAARDAAEAMAEFREHARAELERPIEDARAALSARVEKARAELEAMTKTFDAAAADIDALNAEGRALDQGAAAAILVYREENLAARTTQPPAYFDAPPPSSAPSEDALLGCAAMLDQARALVVEAQDQFSRGLEALGELLSAAQARLDAAHPE